MRILALLLCLVSFNVLAASPVINGTLPSRTTCTAPCAVFFDATGATDADLNETSQFAYLQLNYVWNFGDGTAGNWSNGATIASKNFAKGPVAAHVYETAGAFTWSMSVTDGTSTDTETGTITVTAADTTFATTATYCIANVTATAGAGGCPIGATTPAGTSDFDVAVATHIGTNRRLLFKRGDTFTASAVTTITADGPWHIGDYGTGAKPLIEMSHSGNAINIGNQATTGINDFAIYNLNFDCNSSSTCKAINGNGTFSQLTVLGVEMSLGMGLLWLDSNVLDVWNATATTTVNGAEAAGQTVITVTSATGIADGNAISIALANGDYHVTTVNGSPAGNDVTITSALPADTGGASNGAAVQTWALPFAPTHVLWNQIFMTGSTVNCLFGAQAGQNGFYGSADKIAFLGNNVDTCGAGEHGIRSMRTSKVVYDSNTVDVGGAANSAITARSLYFGGTPTVAASNYSEYGVFRNNKTLDSQGGISITSTNVDIDGRWRFFIVEQNLITAGAVMYAGIEPQGSQGAVRNNIIDLTGATSASGNVGIWAGKQSQSLTAPNATYQFIENNTIYRSDSNGTAPLIGVRVVSGSTNFLATNNLMYAPVDTAGSTCVIQKLADPADCVTNGTSAGGVTSTANSTIAQSQGTNPFEQTPSSTNPQTYRPAAAAYADTGGTAAYPASVWDFGNCVAANGTDIPIGAWHPKSSVCVGVAKGATQ